jgi:hypothetical protein
MARFLFSSTLLLCVLSLTHFQGAKASRASKTRHITPGCKPPQRPFKEADICVARSFLVNIGGEEAFAIFSNGTVPGSENTFMYMAGSLIVEEEAVIDTLTVQKLTIGGTTLTAAQLVGPPGATGEQGIQGEKGDTGAPGTGGGGGLTLVDSNNVVLGIVTSVDRSVITILTSNGYLTTILWNGAFLPVQILYTSRSNEGTCSLLAFGVK